ncbi:hypothetical protein [Streptomyces sp. T028]|uniref:hypothetical protein n=1 Tax=Streptomyces sp. T028 TaxID=3394379 RepID=UPI003A84765F
MEPTSTAPLAARASGKRVCDMVAERSLRDATGGVDYVVQDNGGPVYRSNRELNFAYCRVLLAGDAKGTDADLLEVRVAHGTDTNLLRDVYAGRKPQKYPVAEVPGYVEPQSFVDPEGAEHPGAVAKAQWGDWTIFLTLRRSPEGRDPSGDVVALSRQVADSLKLSKEREEPLPSAADLGVTATPDR